MPLTIHGLTRSLLALLPLFITLQLSLASAIHDLTLSFFTLYLPLVSTNTRSNVAFIHIAAVTCHYKLVAELKEAKTKIAELQNAVEDANTREAGLCGSQGNFHHTFIFCLHVCMHSHFSV